MHKFMYAGHGDRIQGVGDKVKNSVTGSKAWGQGPRHGVADQLEQNPFFKKAVFYSAA